VAQINKTTQIEIDANPAHVWNIITTEYAEIGNWASSILNSDTIVAPVAVDGLKDTARSCELPGFGTTNEVVTHHDASARELTYSVTASKMPSFATDMENAWKVTKGANGGSVVTSVITGNANGMLGALMRPMMAIQLGGNMRQIFADLKIYAETGSVSKAKLKVNAKLVAAK